MSSIADRNRANADPLIGATVAQFFRVERKLAAGGMGAVYLVRHLSLSISKVIKIMLPEYAQQPAVRVDLPIEADVRAAGCGLRERPRAAAAQVTVHVGLDESDHDDDQVRDRER